MVGRIIRWLLRPLTDAFSESVVKAFMKYREEKEWWIERKMVEEIAELVEEAVAFSKSLAMRSPEEASEWQVVHLQRLISIALSPYPKARRFYAREYGLELESSRSPSARVAPEMAENGRRASGNEAANESVTNSEATVSNSP